MTMPKSLPARPSQESLRKQAKKLARDIGTGNAAAIARAGGRSCGVMAGDVAWPLRGCISSPKAVRATP